jgi:hypothetical protein
MPTLAEASVLAEAHNNLANAFHLQDDLAQAASHYQEALRLRPDYAEAHSNLALVLVGQAKLDAAEEHYRRALELKPDLAGVRWNRSLLWLLRGDFERGWQEYEWRQRAIPEFTTRHFPQPLWDGSAFVGRTLLLIAEQGLGDALHFIRYVPWVKERGGTVIVECLPELLRVLACVPGIDRLVPRGSPLPPFDVQMPLMSLPRLFETALSNIAANVPYLWADPRFVGYWRGEPKKDEGGRMKDEKKSESDLSFILHPSSFQVGIAWQGSPTYRYDRQRSIPLACFASLAQVQGVRLVSLQKGPGREQLLALHYSGSRFVFDLDENLDETAGPFMDTAAVMTHLDLIISSDTAIPHLAGALSIPVWVPLPYVPNWRWLLEREDSPWYPTMRLFRQSRPGRWEDVFERMVEELGKVVKLRLAGGSSKGHAG